MPPVTPFVVVLIWSTTGVGSACPWMSSHRWGRMADYLQCKRQRQLRGVVSGRIWIACRLHLCRCSGSSWKQRDLSDLCLWMKTQVAQGDCWLLPLRKSIYRRDLCVRRRRNAQRQLGLYHLKFSLVPNRVYIRVWRIWSSAGNDFARCSCFRWWPARAKSGMWPKMPGFWK